MMRAACCYVELDVCWCVCMCVCVRARACGRPGATASVPFAVGYSAMILPSVRKRR